MILKLKGKVSNCKVPTVSNLGHERFHVRTVRASASLVDSLAPEMLIAGGSILGRTSVCSKL
jgi:hypothetical protein